MSCFKLTLGYDGTSFVGWQRQASGISIQGLLEDAIAELEGAPVVVHGAGRTDAGVHALGQVASVSLTRSIDSATLVRAVNARLPPTVRVLDACPVSDAFHARFSARSKTYRYRIWNGLVLTPFEHAYVWHIPSPMLDADAMNRAAALLEGRHDFSAFQTAGAETESSERLVMSCGVHREAEGPLIVCEISGDGFLRHMVRSIAGTLVEVGRGRYPPTWVKDVLASRDRSRAGRTAPAAGLFLVGIEYDEPDL